MATTAELGDKTVTVRDGHVIDAVPAVTGPHAGLGGEHIAAAGQRDETMSHPAATVTGPQLLQAQANAVSARLKIKPP